MKLFQIPDFGIDQLQLVDADPPKLAAGHVLVRMTAASLNFRDLMVVKGAYNPKLRRPMIPLSDGAGIVEEVGDGVTLWKAGDRVAGIFMQTWIEGPIDAAKAKSALGGGLDGVLAEYVSFPESGLVAAPTHLTDEETAALPCAAVTAWHALFEHTPPAPGSSVLLQGTGGVSIFALQLAVAAGLRTVVISSSDEKLARAKSLGASHLINYREKPEWDKEARTLTGGLGVDHVIEVGGSGTVARSLRAVRPGGTVSVIGALSGAEPSIDPRAILMNSLRVQGIYVGSRVMFERLNRAMELHRLRPVVDKVFSWTEFPSALRHMESASHFGKIVLKF